MPQLRCQSSLYVLRRVQWPSRAGISVDAVEASSYTEAELAIHAPYPPPERKFAPKREVGVTFLRQKPVPGEKKPFTAVRRVVLQVVSGLFPTGGEVWTCQVAKLRSSTQPSGCAA